MSSLDARSAPSSTMPALLRNNLGVVCGPCGFLNVVGATKCMACGSATDGPAAKDATAEKPKLALADAPTNPSGTQAVPPGLRRSSSSSPSLDVTPPVAVPSIPPPHVPTPVAPSLAEATVSPSQAQRAMGGVPARPTFQSSAAPIAGPGTSAPKFGLSVLGGPMRGQRFRLAASGAQIGKSKGVVLFPDDPFVSPLHATLSTRDGKLFLRDEDSTSGVYVSINGQETIAPHSYFCAGLRLFRYLGPVDQPPPVAPGRMTVYGAPVPPNQVHYVVEEILLGNRPGRAVLTAGPILTVGQSKCDLTYPTDEGLATRHCELSPMPSGAMIRDLSGGLGTYVRVTKERQLKPGDRVRFGQQTLQVEQLS